MTVRLLIPIGIHNTSAEGGCLPLHSEWLQHNPAVSRTAGPGLQRGSWVNGGRWVPIAKHRPPAKVFDGPGQSVWTPVRSRSDSQKPSTSLEHLR